MNSQKELPPYVTFTTRAEEDRSASVEQGKAVFRDVDYALITPMGSRDRVERVVSDWFAMLKKQVEEGRFDGSWLDAFQSSYERWKRDNTLPEEGTSLRNWSYLTPAQVQNCLNWHVTTIEHLARANEETIRRLGMGGQSLVNAAKDYLAQSQDSGKMVAELAALREENSALKARNTSLTAQVDELQKKVAAQAAKA